MKNVKNLKPSTEVILKELATRYPDQTEFRKQQIVDVGQSFGYKPFDLLIGFTHFKNLSRSLL